ncbi:MAG TPA: ATP-binding protein [Bryobacteraceae bacterium]|nr:ATP-binding protein [Bryobacteraceae bacterium]
MSLRPVLLVDTGPVLAEALAPALSRENRALETAPDGPHALDRLRAGDWELLVAGPNANGLDSLELLRRARAIRPDLKVILTGESDPLRVLTALRSRAFSYFHRPVAPAALVDMVQQALAAASWKNDLRVVSARREWITIEVRCRLQAVERTTHYLREFLADLPAQACEDVAIAFRELLMNAVEHGGKYDPHKRARVSLVRTSRALIVHIADPGTGFSFDFLPNSALSNPAGSPTQHAEFRAGHGQRPGGFGILMSRQLVDDLIYNERGNAVLFMKYL